MHYLYWRWSGVNELQQVYNLNRQPVNQICRRLLEKARVNPDPGVLYLFQLVKWGLNTGKVELDDQGNKYTNLDTSRAAEMLMYETNPQRAMDFLLKEGPDEGAPAETWVKTRLLAKQKTPAEAAYYLADSLRNAVEYQSVRDPALED
jgi:hypothetical protein